MPGRSDLCYATTNRQGAVKAVAPQVRRDGRARLGQLVEHRCALQRWQLRPAARGCSG